MAASFVLRGALNQDLFVDSGTEMWFTFAKLQPFLKDVRQQANSPHFYARIEKVATRTKDGRERVQMMAKRAESMRARAAKA
jgi:ferritin-like metal-binding protein YciE